MIFIILWIFPIVIYTASQSVSRQSVSQSVKKTSAEKKFGPPCFTMLSACTSFLNFHKSFSHFLGILSQRILMFASSTRGRDQILLTTHSECFAKFYPVGQNCSFITYSSVPKEGKKGSRFLIGKVYLS